MSAHLELKQYHDELIGWLEGIAYWEEDDPPERSAKAILEASKEISAAFHAMRARLPGFERELL